MGSKKGRRPGGGRACFPTTLGKASLWLQTDFDMISWVPQGRTSSGLSSSWGGTPKQHVPFLLSPFFPTGQVDLDLLRCQQLKLYILKAGRALLSHQDQLRQILSQPAVQEAAAAHTGIFLRSSFGSVRKAEIENRQGTWEGKYRWLLHVQLGQYLMKSDRQTWRGLVGRRETVFSCLRI